MAYHPSGQPEGDRMEIRPYAPGDSVKNIIWKVYARSRQLNVRLPEHSVFQSKKTLAFLLTSENDEAAAAVARVALQSGALKTGLLVQTATKNQFQTMPRHCQLLPGREG